MKQIHLVILAAVIALAAGSLLAPASQASNSVIGSKRFSGVYRGIGLTSGDLGLGPTPGRQRVKVRTGHKCVGSGLITCFGWIRGPNGPKHWLIQKKARLFVGESKAVKIPCSDAVYIDRPNRYGVLRSKVRLYPRKYDNNGRVQRFAGKFVYRVFGCSKVPRQEVVRLRRMELKR